MAIKQIISEKTFQICYKTIIAIFVIGLLFSLKKFQRVFKEGAKEDQRFCDEEYKLKFNEVITEYNGYGFKSRPIHLLLNDSLLIIPRSNLDMSLHVGDTIIKPANGHTYYIYQSSLHLKISGKSRDTIHFECR